MPSPDRLSKSSLAERYCQHWQSDGSADGLERFLAHYSGLSIVPLVDVLLIDQALEWQGGAAPTVEQYVQRFPNVLDQPGAVVELVYGEMRAVHGLGLPVDVDAYVARFPELAESLRRQLELSEWLVDEGTNTKPADPTSS